jgi:lysine/ornithine N-monooxygenase
MKIEFVDISKEEIIKILNDYSQKSDELFELIEEFKSADIQQRQKVKEELKQKYKAVKDEIRELYDYFNKSSVRPEGYTASILAPAIRDIYVHISSVGTNSISLNNISKVSSAVYDIGDYARYWLSQIK